MCFLWGVRLPFRKTAIKKYEGKIISTLYFQKLISGILLLLELKHKVCLEESRCYNESTCHVLNPFIFSEKSQRPAPV